MTAAEFGVSGPGGPDLTGMVARLERLRGRAVAAAAAWERAASLLPEAGDGQDPSRVVAVRVGRDGLPDEIRVATDWDRRVGPGEVAGAVMTAYRAAVADRYATWGDRLEQHHALPSRQRAAPASPRAASGSVAGWAGGAGAGFGEREMTEIPAMLARTNQLLHARPRPGPAGPADLLGAAGLVVTGRGGGGHVQLTVTAGALTGCSAEPSWAAGQSAARLTAALHDAVRDARTQIAAAPSPAPSGIATGGDLDRLAAEVMALLGAPPPPPAGGRG